MLEVREVVINGRKSGGGDQWDCMGGEERLLIMEKSRTTSSEILKILSVNFKNFKNSFFLTVISISFSFHFILLKIIPTENRND